MNITSAHFHSFNCTISSKTLCSKSYHEQAAAAVERIRERHGFPSYDSLSLEAHEDHIRITGDGFEDTEPIDRQA